MNLPTPTGALSGHRAMSATGTADPELANRLAWEPPAQRAVGVQIRLIAFRRQEQRRLACRETLGWPNAIPLSQSRASPAAAM